MTEPLERQLANLSGAEMVAALGLGGAPAWVRRAGRAAFAVPSWPLGRVLARFDRRTGEAGLHVAAREALAGFGARWTADAAPPSRGALLVVSNHPGAYDALALMAALGREDLMIVAADRRFLRALPHVSRRLLFVPIDEVGAIALAARSAGVRRALRHLRRGGALLHFPAGRIEADPAFAGQGDALLAAWHPSAGTLLRAAAAAGGRAAVAIVSGVHSPRAKRLAITRWAERRGITTLAPLLQAALPGFDDVEVRVRLGEARDAAEVARGAPDDAALTRRLKDEAAALLAGA
ncbi:1-acyl-sn-glycerol-3-phosphate acyltransferase [Sorangium sp. So ce295]|jgi:1-acyl-sn-glycerol-3-phosphate acyltransferase|uniref:1-acyl-sn-glycerol-3-phosphate acyltransferase n=1 Tax=Sorangium sp. So ce295 TaxID=3133295 RepID=UPI003F5DD560